MFYKSKIGWLQGGISTIFFYVLQFCILHFQRNIISRFGGVFSNRLYIEQFTFLLKRLPCNQRCVFAHNFTYHLHRSWFMIFLYTPCDFSISYHIVLEHLRQVIIIFVTASLNFIFNKIHRISCEFCVVNITHYNI